MPDFKPAYLIRGDDHGRIAERRARLRAMAEAESGAHGVEILEGDDATAEGAATALNAMTLAPGRRFVIVDGAEAWKDKDLEPLLGALAALDPDTTTVAFFAREEGAGKVSAKLVKAVEKAGGTVAAERAVKPWELPKWVAGQGRAIGLEFESGAAKALVDHVGARQQRLLRELEKLRLDLGEGATVSEADVAALAARSVERKAWTLADALVAGDARGAVRLYLDLREQDERSQSLLHPMLRRIRDAQAVALRLEAGESAAAIKGSLRMPPRVASQFIADVGRSDPQAFGTAVQVLADLEQACHGGSELSDDTSTLRAILAIAG